jgi:hypothetical protein
VAGQAWQPRWGAWRPKAGDGTVPWPLPGRPGQRVMTELVSSPGGRIRCRRVLAFQRSGAHTDRDVVLLQTSADVVLLQTPADLVLLQTPAAEKTADKGVELSGEASREVSGFRSANRSHVRVRRERPVPGPTALMAYKPHPRGDRFRAPSMNGSPPAPFAPAGENAPAQADLTRIQAERDTSQRGRERANRQGPIEKPRRRRSSSSASPLSRGVTTPDLPEGI